MPSVPARAVIFQCFHLLLHLAAWVLALFFVLPVVALLMGQSRLALVATLVDPRTYAAVGWTVAAASAAAAATVALGVPLAFLLSGLSGPPRRLARLGLRGLQALPQPVIGVGLVLFLDRWGVLPTLLRTGSSRAFVALAGAMAFVAAPGFVAVLVRAFVTSAAPLVRMARSLGADPWEAFWCCALPSVAADLRSAVLDAWASAAGELGVLLLVASLPVSGTVAVWLAWGAGRADRAAALGLVLLVAVAAVLAAWHALLRRLWRPVAPPVGRRPLWPAGKVAKTG